MEPEQEKTTIKSSATEESLETHIQKDAPVTINPDEWFKSDDTPSETNKNRVLLILANKKFILIFIGFVIILSGSLLAYKKYSNNNRNNDTVTEETARDLSGSDNSSSTDTIDAMQPSGDDTATTSETPSSTNTSSGTQTSNTPNTNNSGSSSPSQPQFTTHNISYTNSCYTPSTITIKAGDVIVFKNNTTNKNMWPATDKHPQHNDYPEFDANNDIPPGSTYSFKFTKKGVWGFHDHIKPSCNGTITVN